MEFLERIFPLAGISPDAHPSFRRSVIANQKEEIGNILSAAPFLDRDTVTEQLCAALGLTDRTGEIIRKKREEETKNGKENGDE